MNSSDEFLDPRQQQHYGKIKVVDGYALQQRLGSGSFATVYKGVKVPPTSDGSSSTSTNSNSSNASHDPSKPDTVAIKAITRSSEKLTKKVLQNLEIEISILRTYRHPNIVCMHNVQKTDHHFYLILEYCAGGDVQILIRTRKSGRLTERLTRRLIRDLAGGLKFLWGQELIHRDIKPQNLLLTGAVPLDELNDPESTPEGEAQRRKTDFPSAKFALKIADFGFARHLQTASLAETLCGSPLYMAPEILQHHRYDAKADLWSVGTVLFEMIAGRPPFNGENHIDLLRNIQRKAVRLPPDVRVSKPCVNLLRVLLNRNPLSRAGFKEFFEACDAFVAQGCEGVAIHDSGTCKIPNKDLGTIQEDDGTSSPNGNGSESLMTVATTAHQPFQQQQQQQQQAPGNFLTQDSQSARHVPPPFNPLSTPTSLVANPPGAGDRNRSYPNRLAPLQQSPPSSSPLLPYPATSRMPSLPGMSHQAKQPWQQTHTTYSTELTQSGRRTEMTQSQDTADGDSGFVMVEHGANSRNDLYPQSGNLGAAPPPPSSSPRYFFQPQPSVVSKGDYLGMNERRLPAKGMLSTSPGTGGLLMGLVGRSPRISNDSSNNSNRLESQIAAANKLIATAEDVGRRAVSVAHLGDTRAYVAMRLVLKCEEGSSVISATPMEDVEEDSREHASHGALTDDSSSTEIMAPARRRSSVSIENTMGDDKIDEDQAEEMPFAISPETPAVSLPSRSNLSIYNRSSSMNNSKKQLLAKPDPRVIRVHFGEALSCYLKALKMLKGSVGASQRVTKDLESIAAQVGTNSSQYDIPKMQKRCEVTSTWLCSQFRGVLERADAANVEIAKLPISETEDPLPVSSVEELVYNHSLALGRDGAVKQLLGQYDAARSCYRSAGLLSEALLMEATVGAEDRTILEGYVDGFAARITELDDMMLQQSRMAGSTSVGSRRGSGIIGLIGPPPSAPSGFLIGSHR